MRQPEKIMLFAIVGIAALLPLDILWPTWYPAAYMAALVLLFLWTARTVYRQDWYIQVLEQTRDKYLDQLVTVSVDRMTLRKKLDLARKFEEVMQRPPVIPATEQVFQTHKLNTVRVGDKFPYGKHMLLVCESEVTCDGCFFRGMRNPACMDAFRMGTRPECMCTDNHGLVVFKDITELEKERQDGPVQC